MAELLSPILFAFLFSWIFSVSVEGIFDMFWKVEQKKYDYT
jgi:hypothetical protein